MNELEFHKSSYSGHDQNCVEVADPPQSVTLRDSKHPDLGHLVFSDTEWALFLAAAKDGEL